MTVSRAIILVGYPLSGKTTYALSGFFKNFEYINPELFDDGGVADVVDRLIYHEKSFIVDACNPSPDDRKAYIDLIKNYPDQNGHPRYSIECHYIDADLNQVRQNGCRREMLGGERLNVMKLHEYRKKFKMPTKEEGFHSITVRPFVFCEMKERSNKAIFFSLDGVARMPFGKSQSNEDVFKVIPGFNACLTQFAEQGFKPIIVTNQPAVSRGEITLRSMQRSIVATIKELTANVEDVYYCPHDDIDQCHCRMPLPYFANQAEIKHKLDLSESIMIGSNIIDKQFAKTSQIGKYYCIDDVMNYFQEGVFDQMVERMCQ